MIATLTGTISEKFADALVVEAAGVGYEVLVATEDWGAARVGGEGRWYIYEQIREDAHVLFGFRELAARQLFTQLLTVSGVGPKVALGVLSAAGVERLRQAIVSGDAALFKGITGVGPKTAARIIMELKGKVEDGGSAGLAPVADSTYQALVALGYSPTQATAAVQGLPAAVTDEQERLKLALRQIGK